jgi:putative membrane protein
MRWENPLLLFAVLAGFVVSGITPFDRLTWLLEVVPVLIALPLLIATYKRFPLTPLTYRLIALHMAIVLIGAHYTYAQVPVGYWVQELFDLSRNHYDRFGHLAQGFIPAIIAREILIRRSPLVPGKWLFFLVTCVCLAISACYEFMEWWVSLLAGAEGDAFLATQGDVWDTQWDMFLAMCGAIAAQWLLGRVHDRQLARVHVGLR